MSDPNLGAVERLRRLTRIRGAVEMAVGEKKGGRLLEDIQFLLDLIPKEGEVVASVLALPRLCSPKVVDPMIADLVAVHGDALAGRYVIVDWREVSTASQGLGTYIASRVRGLGALPAHRVFPVPDERGWLGERP